MTIYVITAHQFNHIPPRSPLDSRFSASGRNYVYYLVDEEVPQALQGKSVILEKKIDPLLWEAGANHLGEWSFLLAEAKHGFCNYPFFMISSRFYQKNTWLISDLNAEWESIFAYLQQFGWGFLPSYDRPLRWLDLSWKEKIEKEIWRYKFFPFTEKTFALIEELYGVKVPQDYPYMADFFCHYLGFQTREHLLAYVNFYRQLIDAFFDENYQLRVDLASYVRKTGNFRKEKPFTFIIEWFSHLFFFQQNHPFFALHYDGYYAIDERRCHFELLHRTPVPLTIAWPRWLRWKCRELRTEKWLAPLNARWSGRQSG